MESFPGNWDPQHPADRPQWSGGIPSPQPGGR